MKRAIGTVALVTGAGSGIGAAAAERLAQLGCNVAINYSRSAEGAEAVAERCRAHGVEAITLKGNVGEDADCRAMVEQVIAALGRLDVLVNSAGITRRVPANDLEALTGEDFAAVNAINVAGTFQMVRAAAPHLKASGAGAVVNISSDSGITGDGSSLAYAASKGALNTLTLGLARELAPSVRVNAVCPGFVDTTWALAWQDGDSYAKFRQRVADLAPLKTIPSVDDIADTIEWLIFGARTITGQLILVDGGTHLTAGNPLIV